MSDSRVSRVSACPMGLVVHPRQKKRSWVLMSDKKAKKSKEKDKSRDNKKAGKPINVEYMFEMITVQLGQTVSSICLLFFFEPVFCHDAITDYT